MKFCKLSNNIAKHQKKHFQIGPSLIKLQSESDKENINIANIPKSNNQQVVHKEQKQIKKIELDSLLSIFSESEGQQILEKLNFLELNKDKVFFFKKLIIQNSNYLEKHSLSKNYRAILVDWMTEVMINLKLKNLTFFFAVSLVDQYLSKQTQKMTEASIHLASVVSLFIAIKYEEQKNFSVEQFILNLTHNKYSVSEFLQMEIDILTILDFDICHWYLGHYIQHIGLIISNDSSVKNISTILKIASFMSLVSAQDFELNTSYNLCQLTLGIYNLAFNILDFNCKNKSEINYQMKKLINKFPDQDQSIISKISYHLQQSLIQNNDQIILSQIRFQFEEQLSQDLQMLII